MEDQDYEYVLLLNHEKDWLNKTNGEVLMSDESYQKPKSVSDEKYVLLSYTYIQINFMST